MQSTDSKYRGPWWGGVQNSLLLSGHSEPPIKSPLQTEPVQSPPESFTGREILDTRVFGTLGNHSLQFPHFTGEKNKSPEILVGLSKINLTTRTQII